MHLEQEPDVLRDEHPGPLGHDLRSGARRVAAEVVVSSGSHRSTSSPRRGRSCRRAHGAPPRSRRDRSPWPAPRRPCPAGFATTGNWYSTIPEAATSKGGISTMRSGSPSGHSGASSTASASGSGPAPRGAPASTQRRRHLGVGAALRGVVQRGAPRRVAPGQARTDLKRALHVGHPRRGEEARGMPVVGNHEAPCGAPLDSGPRIILRAPEPLPAPKSLAPPARASQARHRSGGCRRAACSLGSMPRS